MKKLRDWQAENMLYPGMSWMPANAAAGYPQQVQRPMLVSGQAEAVWFETGRGVRYGRRHLIRRRTRG